MLLTNRKSPFLTDQNLLVSVVKERAQYRIGQVSSCALKINMSPCGRNVPAYGEF